MPTINELKKKALNDAGYTGSISDAEYKWLKEVCSPYVGSIPDMWRYTLNQAGYTGLLSDAQNKMLSDLGHTGALPNKWYKYWRDTPLQGGGEFTPGVLTTLAWYDPSDLTTLWQDTAGTTPVTADSDPVARIDDKSGNGRNLLQIGDSTTRPLYKTAGGLHWVESDGVNDYLQATITGWTGFTAVIANSIVTDGTGDIGIEISATSRGDALWQQYTPATNGTYSSLVRGAAFAVQAQASAAFTAGVAQVRSSRVKQNDFQFWKDGVSLGTDTSGVWPAATLTRIALFSGTGGTTYGNERFYGGVFAATMTTEERENTEAWLAAKAGVTLP